MASRSRRALVKALVIAAAAGIVVPLLPGAGEADTIANVRSEIAAAQRQLTRLDGRTEAATNAYDLARIQLTTAQRRVGAAEDSLSAAQAVVRRSSRQLAAMVSAAYQDGGLGSLAALAAAGGPQAFLDRAGSLQALSSGDAAALAGYKAASEARQQAALAARQALGAKAAVVGRLRAQRRAILSQARQEQALLATLQTKERELMRAAELAAQRQAAAAARARARQLAAEQAAAAAAAASFAATSPTPAPSVPTGGPVGSGAAAIAVRWAYRELGKPYVWGAAGPNAFDCSGLTQFVWAKAGVYLDHYTGDQWHEGTHVTTPEPGDLVFFVGSDGTRAVPGHVGIYIGNGEMIDAPYTGVDVRIDSIDQPDYVGAVRPY